MINDPLDYTLQQMSFFDVQFQKTRRTLGITLTIVLWSAANIGTFSLIALLNWVIVLVLLVVVNVLCYVLYLVAQLVFAHLGFNVHRNRLEALQRRQDTDPIIIEFPVTQEARSYSQV